MSNEPALVDLTLESGTSSPRLVDCEFIAIDPDSTRLYYRPFERVNDGEYPAGFAFCSVEWASGPAADDLWGASCTVTVVYSGRAYFDGVRHLYLGRDDDLGYSYYPNLGAMMATLAALRELQMRHCDPSQIDDPITPSR
jgi:hypothetical protein